MKKLITICAICFVLAGTAQADFSNPSFETGDLTGWSTTIPWGAWIKVLTTWSSWSATDGSYYALLKTDGGWSTTKLYQSFTASAGDPLSFDAFFKAGDYWPYNDGAYVKIMGPVTATLWSQSVGTVGSYGSTPWQSVSYTIPVSGSYTLECGIYNAYDSGWDSYVGVDNVHVIPAPGAVLLGILGLGAAGVKLRKFT